MPPHDKKHGPQWLFNAEGAATPADAGKLLERLGAELQASQSVELDTVRVELPNEIRAIVRHERLPHGALALKLTLEWDTECHQPETRGISTLLNS